MSAPEGNQFWKLNSKHGKEKLFSSPDLLWEAAMEYFLWIDEHPLLEQDFIGKDVIEIHRNKMRPYTMKGLCLYLQCNEKYIYQIKDELFLPVIDKIKSIIFTQKFEGAAAGMLKENLIARDLGLKDSTDITTDGEKINIPHNVSYKGEDVTPKEDV